MCCIIAVIFFLRVANIAMNNAEVPLLHTTVYLAPTFLDINSSNTFSGQVELVENMGAEVLIHIKIKETSFKSVQNRSHNIKIGDSINLIPKKGQVHLFDKEGKVIRNE